MPAGLRAGDRPVPIPDAHVAATAMVEQVAAVTQEDGHEAVPGSDAAGAYGVERQSLDAGRLR